MQSSKITILIVDDMIRYHAIYELAIKDCMDAEVLFAANGLEALDVIKSAHIDIIVLDINMPKLNGEQTLVEIRKNPQYDTTPVLILTGESAANLEERLLDAGADDFVEKGSSPEIFTSRLQSLIKYKQNLDRLTAVSIDTDALASNVLNKIKVFETDILASSQKIRDFANHDISANKASILEEIKQLNGYADSIHKYSGHIIQLVKETRRKSKPKLVEIKEIANQILARLRSQNINLTIDTDIFKIFADKVYLEMALYHLIKSFYSDNNERNPLTVHLSYTAKVSDEMRNKSKLKIKFTEVSAEHVPSVHSDIFSLFNNKVENTCDKNDFNFDLALVRKIIISMHGDIQAHFSKTEKSQMTVSIELPNQ